MSEPLERVVDEYYDAIKRLNEKLARVTAERDNFKRMYEEIRAGVSSGFLDRAEAAEAALSKMTAERDHERREKDTVADAARAHADWSRQKREAAETALSARVRDYNNVVEALKVADRKGDDAMAALSAHREALKETANEWRLLAEAIRRSQGQRTRPRIGDETLEHCAAVLEGRIAALASPRQVEQEHDKNDDHTRVAESSQPDRAALPQRPTS